MQNSVLKTPILGKFGGKIEILSTRNLFVVNLQLSVILLFDICSVRLKIAISCPVYIINRLCH